MSFRTKLPINLRDLVLSTVVRFLESWYKGLSHTAYYAPATTFIPLKSTHYL